MNEKWNNAQREEIIFWSVQNYPLIKEYRDRYKIFDSIIDEKKNLDDYKVIDIGCGAIAYSVVFPFKDLTLYDSLISEYLNLPDGKQNIGKFKDKYMFAQGKTEQIGFLSETFDMAICLNMLDHTEDPEKSLSEICRIIKKDGLLLLSCDMRDKIDVCHPNIINKSMIDIWLKNNGMIDIQGQIIYHLGFDCYQAIIKKT